MPDIGDGPGQVEAGLGMGFCVLHIGQIGVCQVMHHVHCIMYVVVEAPVWDGVMFTAFRIIFFVNVHSYLWIWVLGMVLIGKYSML